MTNHAVYPKLIILSYWNTPSGGCFYWRRWRKDLKGRPDHRKGNQVSGGHLVSPWENPLFFGHGPVDWGRKTKLGRSSVRQSEHCLPSSYQLPPSPFRHPPCISLSLCYNNCGVIYKWVNMKCMSTPQNVISAPM